MTQSAASMMGISAKRYSMSCPPLDHLLDGGLKCDHVLEISGPPGCGKEQMAARTIKSFVQAQQQVLFVGTASSRSQSAPSFLRQSPFFFLCRLLKIPNTDMPTASLRSTQTCRTWFPPPPSKESYPVCTSAPPAVPPRRDQALLFPSPDIPAANAGNDSALDLVHYKILHTPVEFVVFIRTLPAYLAAHPSVSVPCCVPCMLDAVTAEIDALSWLSFFQLHNLMSASDRPPALQISFLFPGSPDALVKSTSRQSFHPFAPSPSHVMSRRSSLLTDGSLPAGRPATLGRSAWWCSIPLPSPSKPSSTTRIK